MKSGLFRQFSICLLSFVILMLNCSNPAAAFRFFPLKAPAPQECAGCLKVVDYSVPKKLEANIKESIESIYGEKQINVIYPQIVDKIKEARENRPAKLYQQDLLRTSDWYKDEIIYMFYVDQFGVIKKGRNNSFRDTINMLDYLQDLGVTTIFMLPFIDSPMGDAGFDIRDPKSVRADLGGMKEFKEFIAEAKKRGLKIKADLILNHFSDQHEWFQQALEGDIKKANYFVLRDELPPYKKYRDEQVGIVVEYNEENGNISKRRLIFPDIVQNHYRKVMINDEDYYFYHTFYPFQIDVNWENPEVLYYMLDVLAHWANIGVDIFRMDAIPYYIKEPGTNAENLPRTHAVIQLLSSYVQAIAPRSVIQAEACQWPKDILPYFGEEETIKHSILCNRKKDLTRTDEVQIAYHFPYMPAIWASMLTRDKNHFWNAYKATPEIPDSATWAVFLRVHDELTLEMVDVKTRKLIYDKLVDKGAEFRKGFGVSGRMANFLDKNPEKIGLAFSILMSLPGIPIIYYGDEIGALNNWEYAKASEAKREADQKAKGADLDVLSFFDSRDINRGPITGQEFYSAINSEDAYKGKIYRKVKNLINARKTNPVVRRGEFEPVRTTQNEVFAYLRTYNSDEMIMVNNLSEKNTSAILELPAKITEKINTNKNYVDSIANKAIKLDKMSGNKIKIELQPYQSLWIKL